MAKPLWMDGKLEILQRARREHRSSWLGTPFLEAICLSLKGRGRAVLGSKGLIWSSGRAPRTAGCGAGCVFG